jgi:protein SCO1/2
MADEQAHRDDDAARGAAATAEPPAAQVGDAPPARGRPDWRLVAPVVLILIVVGVAAALIARGGKATKQALPNNVRQARAPNFRGDVATPAVPAPPLALDNYLGQPVSLSAYRGKAVLVTFLYANCPTLCPLIESNLRAAQSMMGASASRVQMIAVSVDPRGDTPRAVGTFLRQHGMVGRMQYLVGSARQLPQVWTAWNVGSQRDAQQPDLINHSGLVFGIGASGKLTTLYPGNFKPSDIAHDIPGLLSS